MIHQLLQRQPKFPLLLLLLAHIPAILFLFTIKFQTVVPVHHLTRDPAAVMDAPMYTGLLSNIGVLLWCAAAAICFFGYTLFQGSSIRGTSLFFLCSGFISLMLLTDDFFMLHEAVFPKILSFMEKDTAEKTVFAFYGITLMAYLFYLRRFILANTDFILLVTAFIFFGLSVMIDVADMTFGDDYDGNIYEDGTKFLGIVSWITYFSLTAYKLVKASLIFPVFKQELVEY
jgi:hypothetical protein